MTKYSPTGELAHALTDTMIESLQEIETCIPAPRFVPNRNTAIALLNRGFIETNRPGIEINPKTLYYLTPKGSTALRISRLQRERRQA